MRIRSNSFVVPLSLLATPLALAACSSSSGTSATRITGQTSFVSAPPAAEPHLDLPAAAPSNANSSSANPARTVQETDLYRLEGTRLYYLNSYRGLMVFDVSNVDQPKFLGRSAIFGTPIQMIVNNGIAVVVVADWYGTTDNGDPFHGSIVRGLDATDPTNIKVLGEAKLDGDVQDTRVVGNVLYAVSEGDSAYGWGVYTGAPWDNAPDVTVSSVNFAGGNIQQVASKPYAGWGGVFNVTPNAIMLAHPAPALTAKAAAPEKTILQYLDISDPGGNIVERGSVQVDGTVRSWGADNGRWNLDFADGKIAHVVGCALRGSWVTTAAADPRGITFWRRPISPTPMPLLSHLSSPSRPLGGASPRVSTTIECMSHRPGSMPTAHRRRLKSLISRTPRHQCRSARPRSPEPYGCSSRPAISSSRSARTTARCRRKSRSRTSTSRPHPRRNSSVPPSLATGGDRHRR